MSRYALALARRPRLGAARGGVRGDRALHRRHRAGAVSSPSTTAPRRSRTSRPRSAARAAKVSTFKYPSPMPCTQQGPVLGPPGRSVAGRAGSGRPSQRHHGLPGLQRERQRGRLHRAPRVSDRLDHVRAYYDALNTGDADAVAASLHRRRRALLHAARAARGRADDRATTRRWAVEHLERPLDPRARGRRRGRGRDRVDDDLARPGVGRRAASTAAPSVPLPRRADLRGARLPPLGRGEPLRRPASASTTRGGATRRCSATCARSRPSPRSTRSSARACGASSPPSCARTRGEWEDARWFPNEVFLRCARAGLPRAQVRGALRRRRAAATSPTRCSTEELSRCGSGGLAAGIGAHTSIAMPPIWKFGTEEQKQRYLVPGDPGREDRRARDHRARRRLRRRRHQDPRRARRRRLRRQRLEDVHHQRRARRLHRHRGQDDAGGRPPRALVPGRRPRARASTSRASSRSSAGTPPTRRDRLRGRVRARGEPARRARTRAST